MLGITSERYSPRLARIVTWLGGQVSFEQTRKILEQIGGITVSKSSVWRRMQTWGARLLAEIVGEQARQLVAARTWSTPGQRLLAKGPMGIGIDGALIHLRGEGWKEFKLATVFDVVLTERVDERTGDHGLFGQASDCSYVAHLGGPEELGWLAWGEAQRRDWHAARDTLVIGDGAAWIWNLQAEHFPDSVTLVDWYHATEHLGQAKQQLYPEDGALASRWYNENEKLLYEGHAAQIGRSLDKAAEAEADPERAKQLRQAATYFQNHSHRMQYQDCRNEGWPIGSGTVESGAKQFKVRVTGPGMHWGRPGATRVLAVRSALLTGQDRFDALWERAYNNSPPN